jgi:hypothetical protein
MMGSASDREIILYIPTSSASPKKRQLMTAAQVKSARRTKTKDCFLKKLELELKTMIYDLYLPFCNNYQAPNLVIAFRGCVKLHHEAACMYFGNARHYIDVSWRSKRLFATASEVELGCIRCLRLDLWYLTCFSPCLHPI